MINEAERSKVVRVEEVHRPSTGVAIERRDHQRAESRSRSLVKALSWRVVALAATVSVVLVATGEVRFAAMVGAADALAKIGLYYLHERAWNRTDLGRPGG